MSGGDSGGSSSDEWRSVGGRGGGGTDKCAITERTILNSPVPTVVATLQVGDILLVELETHPRKRVVAKTNANLVAGAITSVNLVDIIECIQSGSVYEAEVLSITGGRIDIEIRLS